MLWPEVQKVILLVHLPDNSRHYVYENAHMTEIYISKLKIPWLLQIENSLYELFYLLLKFNSLPYPYCTVKCKEEYKSTIVPFLC
jgi:hypothetical protein